MKAACEKSQAVCTSLKKEKKTVAPPKLFDLTALQREANRLYGFTAKQTLDYAQALYEKRLLTYPRTDSKYITSDMEGSTKELITGLCAAIGNHGVICQCILRCLAHHSQPGAAQVAVIFNLAVLVL